MPCLLEAVTEKLLHHKSEQTSYDLAGQEERSAAICRYLALGSCTYPRVCTPEISKALPPAQIAGIPPSPSTQAPEGTAAEFTEHKKSVSIALANKNKTQNKRYKYKPNLDHEPKEQAVCPSALLIFLSEKALGGAAMRSPILPHLTPGGNPIFIKNFWRLQFHLKNKQA